MNKRKERVESQLAELETNILIIKANNGEYIENDRLRERLIKQLEELAKVRNDIEDIIESQSSLLEREVLSRRFRGQSYRKIARELEINESTIHNILTKCLKRS